MKKRSLFLIGLTLLVMLILPWLAVTFVPADAGMAVCFLLFFAVNPIYAIILGIFAGKNIKASWFQPLLTALLFLIGVWLVFTMGEPAFLLYAGGYLLLGLLAMGITALLQKRQTAA